jgi:hypothetical protein
MQRFARDGTGSVLVLASLGVLFMGVSRLGGHDYVAAILLVLTGLSLLWAGVELLRPTIGE